VNFGNRKGGCRKPFDLLSLSNTSLQRLGQWGIQVETACIFNWLNYESGMSRNAVPQKKLGQVLFQEPDPERRGMICR